MAKINIGNPLKNITVNVKYTGVQKLKWRIRLAKWFFHLGAWALGCEVEVSKKENKNDLAESANTNG